MRVICIFDLLLTIPMMLCVAGDYGDYSLVADDGGDNSERICPG